MRHPYRNIKNKLTLFFPHLFSVALILFFFGSSNEAGSQDTTTPVSGDTLLLIHLPENVSFHRSLTIGKNQVWMIDANHRLYRWRGDGLRDISQPNEEYHHIFAADSSDIWLHVYLKDQTRFVFKRTLNGHAKMYPNPENFRITSIWVNNPHDIWASGIVGTLLHFDGENWRRYPGFTNHHIEKACLDEKQNGWLAVENTHDSLDLYRVSLKTKQVNFIREIGRSYSLMPAGIWYFAGDSLVFFSDNTIKQSYFLPYSEIANVVLPVFKNASLQYSGALTWIVQETNVPAYLLFVKSEKEVLKLTEQGQIQKLTATSLNSKIASQFVRGILYSDHEYTVGCDFINQDNYLDFYLIVPDDKNDLVVSDTFIRSDGTSGFNQQKKTTDFQAVEAQATGKGQTYYDNGILIADLNNDGDQDLFITAHQGSNLYFENLTFTRFEDRTDFANLYDDHAANRWNMAIAGDVDNDGDLDLFVTREYNSNVLYLNNGIGRFREVTREANLLSERGGMGAAFGDIDNDGDLDLFVANWRAKNRLYRNDGQPAGSKTPRFTDITDFAGVGLDDSKRSNAAIFGDADNDGDLDLYVTNRFDADRYYCNLGQGRFQDFTKQAGLYKENTFSEGAVFFDADHDSDLDLAVSCNGQNLFFRNHGKGRFQPDHEVFGTLKEDNTASIMSGDFNNDGDVDLYVTSRGDNSYTYKNLQNDQRFIKLHLEGFRSNRNAVGTKVFFYEAGHLGKAEHLLGLRTVEAGSGLASTSSKVVHFGTGDQPAVDCKIVFPSGVTLLKKHVLPGSSLKIDELSGNQKILAQLKRTLLQQIKMPQVRMECLAYFVFLSFMFGIFPHIKREKWKQLSWHYNLPILTLVILRVFFHDQTLNNRLGLPLAFGILTYLLVLQFRYQKYQQQQQDELTGHLWQELRQFQHGDWARSNLNQLLLFTQNITPENQTDKPLRNKLLENINTFIKLTQASLSAIVRIARPIPEFRSLSDSIDRARASIYRVLENCKNLIQVGERLPVKKLQQMAEEVILLKTAVDSLSSRVEKRFQCEIRPCLEAIRDSSANYQPLTIGWHLESIPPVCIRMRATELTPIVDNLIQNALTATQGQASPHLTISGQQKDGRLYLRFADNGKGIAKNKHEIIFEPGYSTANKTRKGHGLAFSRKVLQKYGGDIYVAQSKPGYGAEMVVELIILC